MEAESTSVTDTVADSGFPKGGGANRVRVRAPTYYLDNSFSENCMKMKKIRAREGGRASLAPLRSATATLL